MWQEMLDSIYDVVPYDQTDYFVKESNAIESIYDEPGSPLFDNHVKALVVALYAEDIDVKLWHKTLFEGVSVPDLVPGEYRTCDVHVGAFIPPHYESVGWYMSVLLDDIKSKAQISPLTPVGCWHYHCWFETIHPFVDGNGRVGRLLLAHLFDKYVGTGLPVVRSSTRFDYYDLLEHWRVEEDPRI